MKTVEQRIAEGISLAERAGAGQQQLTRALLLFQEAAAQHLDETLLELPDLDRFDAAFLRGGDIGWVSRANLALKYQLINSYQREALLTMEQAIRPLLLGQEYSGTAFHVRRYGQFVAALCRPRQFRADDISPLVPEEALLPPRGADRWRRWRARSAGRRQLRILGGQALLVAVAAVILVALIAAQLLREPRSSADTPRDGSGALGALSAPRRDAALPTAALAATATPARVLAAIPTAAPTATPEPTPALSPGDAVVVSGLSAPLDARAAPERAAGRVFSVRNGDVLQLVDGVARPGEGGQWLQVRISGLVGWLPAEHLAPTGNRASQPATS